MELLFASIGIAIAGGIVRGITGFGGSMVMTPALSLLFEPQEIVPTVLLLETIAAAPMLRHALKTAQFNVIGPICLASFVTVPLGSHMLASLDANILRNWIAGTVLAFSLLLLGRFRYRGPRNLSASVAVGVVSGVLLGGTGIGGPPIILYMFSGDGPVATHRANLTLCVSLISIAGLAMLWHNGLLSLGGTVSPLILGPGFFLGTIVGMQCFHRLKEQTFRQLTLIFLILISVVALVR